MQEVNIEDRAIIGKGSVVIKNVLPYKNCRSITKTD